MSLEKNLELSKNDDNEGVHSEERIQQEKALSTLRKIMHVSDKLP